MFIEQDERKYLYTRFTITLHDMLIEDPTFLDNLKMSTDERTTKLKNMFIAKWDIYEVSGETPKTAKLYIDNKFNMYKDYYEELISAYETKIEMLDGKLTSIEIDDTLSSTIDTNLTNTGNSSENNTHNDNGNDNHFIDKQDTYNETNTNEQNKNLNVENYDLPRKTTSENSPSTRQVQDDTTGINISIDRTKNSHTQDNHTYTNSGTYENTIEDTRTEVGKNTKEETKNKTITTKGQENVIELKKKYMELLRNVYLEFVNRFEPCFLSLYY